MKAAGPWFAGGVVVCALGAVAPWCVQCARSASAVEPAIAARLPDAEFVFAPDAVFPDSAKAPRHVGRTAVPVMVDGEGVSAEFASASPASPEHPGGTIGVLVCKHQPKPDVSDESDWCDLSLDEVDVATARPIAKVPIGDRVEEAALMDGAHGAIVWVRAGKGESSLVRFEGIRRIVARQSMRTLDRDRPFSPCKFTAVGDQVVLSNCGEGQPRFVRSWTVDADGRFVAKHDCPGAPTVPRLFADAYRNRVLITGLFRDSGEWACSFDVDAPPVAARRLSPGTNLFVQGDEALLQVDGHLVGGDAFRLVVRKTHDDLSPFGAAFDGPERPMQGTRCTSHQLGTMRDERIVEGFAVVGTHYCCGERGPSNLYICDPHADSL